MLSFKGIISIRKSILEILSLNWHQSIFWYSVPIKTKSNLKSNFPSSVLRGKQRYYCSPFQFTEPALNFHIKKTPMYKWKANWYCTCFSNCKTMSLSCVSQYWDFLEALFLNSTHAEYGQVEESVALFKSQPIQTINAIKSLIVQQWN